MIIEYLLIDETFTLKTINKFYYYILKSLLHQNIKVNNFILTHIKFVYNRVNKDILCRNVWKLNYDNIVIADAKNYESISDIKKKYFVKGKAVLLFKPFHSIYLDKYLYKLFKLIINNINIINKNFKLYNYSNMFDCFYYPKNIMMRYQDYIIIFRSELIQIGICVDTQNEYYGGVNMQIKYWNNDIKYGNYRFLRKNVNYLLDNLDHKNLLKYIAPYFIEDFYDDNFNKMRKLYYKFLYTKNKNDDIINIDNIVGITKNDDKNNLFVMLIILLRLLDKL